MIELLTVDTGLLPCPFCGEKPKLWDNGICDPVIDGNGAYVDMFIHSPDMYGVECTKCNCQNIGYNSEEEAIEGWNRRKT